MGIRHDSLSICESLAEIRTEKCAAAQTEGAIKLFAAANGGPGTIRKFPHPGIISANPTAKM
jgi:hypothetical protein